MPIVVAVLAAWSCSSRDELQSEQERVSIRLSASLDDSETRASRAGTTINNTQSTEFLSGQAVDAYIKAKGGDWMTGLSATTPRHFEVTGTSGDLDRKSGEAMDYYPMDATPVTIYAVHPSVASAAAFTVSNDQTDADNYAASDLCYSKTADYNRTEAKQTLRFKHVLSKIVVNVDVSEIGSPAVSNLRLKAKTKTSITYPYPSDATNDYLIGSASEVDFIKMNVSGAAVIPPQTTTAAGDVLITFDVAGVGPIAYKFPANTSFASNTQYIYTVRVGGSISVTSTITDWYAGTYSSGDELMIKRSAKYNPLWYMAKRNITSAKTEGKWTFAANELAAGNYYAWYYGMVNFTNYTPTENHDHGYNGWIACNIDVYGESSTWHLPTQQEWLSIIPLSNYYYENIFSNTSPAKETIVEEHACTFGYPAAQTPQAYKAYWSDYNGGSPSVPANTRYAIRFLNTPYCSVWKYQFTSGSPGKLVISSKLIDIMSDEDTDANKAVLKSKMDEIINASSTYWSENESEGSIQRTLGANGYLNTDNSTYSVPNVHGYFLSTTWGLTGTGTYYMGYNWNNNTDYYYELWFYDGGLYLGPVNETTQKSVRLFRDN